MCEVFIETVDNIYFKIYLESSPKTVADREKEGKIKTQEFEYLENENSFFLGEIKSIFHSF